MAKATETKSASTARTAPKRTRSAAETKKIHNALVERRDELQAEYDQTLTEITELQRERLTDSAGDDQADTGTKTFEREQEITLANNLLERITQVERAIDRLGHRGLVGVQRRSSSCLQCTHRVADGNAASRSTGIALPHRSHQP